MASGGSGVAKEATAYQPPDLHTVGGRVRVQRSGIDGPGLGERGKGAVGAERSSGGRATGSGSRAGGGSRLGQRLGADRRRATAGQDLLHAVPILGESLCASLLAGTSGDVFRRPHESVHVLWRRF